MFKNLDKRKVLLIALLIIGLGVLGWLVYIAARPEPPPANVNNANVGPGPGFPPVNGNTNLGGINLPPPETNVNVSGVPTFPEISPVASGGPTATPTLTQGPALTPVGGAGGEAMYYDPSDGKFYEISPDGTRRALADASYPAAERVTWSPGRSQAILEFPDGANIIYDLKAKKQYTLPKEMTEFSFSPEGEKIAGKFMGENVADRWLVTVNPDGSALTGVEPMGENADKVDVEWSANNQVVALSRTGQPRGLFEQHVLLIGFQGENFKGLNIEGRGFVPRWSPDGNRLLYSVYNDTTNYRPTLYLVDGATDRVGGNKQSLGLQTWADKCTFIGGTAYCAVPQSLPDGAGYVRELANNIPDTIWKVDIATGAKTTVAQPVGDGGSGLTANNLTVSGDGRFLYFTDANGRLRSVQLKP